MIKSPQQQMVWNLAIKGCGKDAAYLIINHPEDPIFPALIVTHCGVGRAGVDV